MSIRVIQTLCLLPLALAWATTLAAAADDRRAPRRDEQRGELKSLQERIQALQREIGRAEGSRADAMEELRETERGISEANRRLRELASEREVVQASLNALNSQSQKLGERLGGQREQLGRLLARQYMAGESDALHHLLSGNDPDQIARDTHYLALLSRAKAELIDGLNDTLEDKKRLASSARDKNMALAAIEQHEQRGRGELLTQQKKRQTVLARVAEKIKAQRREVDSLRRDERRLTRLVEGLGRIAARPKRASRSPTTGPLRNERMPDATIASDGFARLKGRLRLPARGELGNRFGTPRQEGGSTWRGLFIRAPGGGEVKAIAAGRVVFADWLRGFGNLIIIDHGDHYLSVYGNNESVFKEVGHAVAAGETVASVGNSGGNPETGLYFELRYLGQPLDPLKWVTLR